MKLWLVKIDDEDFDYDRFESAVVWADSAEEAERIMRAEIWCDDRPWVTPAWRLHVEPAKTEGVALVHWVAG